MDALALTYLANTDISQITQNKQENKQEKELKEQFNTYLEAFGNTKDTNSVDPFTIISIIISLVIGCIAATLSWNCNTAKEVSVGLKIIFAFFAFIFGLIYIVLYLIFLSDCGK